MTAKDMPSSNWMNTFAEARASRFGKRKINKSVEMPSRVCGTVFSIHCLILLYAKRLLRYMHFNKFWRFIYVLLFSAFRK